MENKKRSKKVVLPDSCGRSDRERRCGKDRRQKNRTEFRYFFINGRRESARREEDKTRIFFLIATISEFLPPSLRF